MAVKKGRADPLRRAPALAVLLVLCVLTGRAVGAMVRPL